MNSRVGVVLVIVLLAGSLSSSVGAIGIGPPVDAPADQSIRAEVQPTAGTAVPRLGTATAVSGTDATATDSAADILHQTIVLRHRPDDPDVFETEMTFRIPDSVTDLEITLGHGATVESRTGFERSGERTLRWTGETDEPVVRYTMPAGGGDGEQQSVESSREGYEFVDTGEWGVVRVPDVSISQKVTEPVGVEEAVSVDGPGATGGDIAFFGEVTEHERAVDGGMIRLVVPEVAQLQESPDAILAALADARGRLEVGAQSDEVFVVAVPSDVDWGPKRGIQYGRSDAWVVDDATFDEANPVWLHEYVHVRQRFSSVKTGTAPETDWLVEAQADYYAGLLALESGRSDFDDFATLLERGEQSPYADGVLTDRSSWQDRETAYTKGALVYGEIDRKLRVATDGDRTLEDVFRTLNAQQGPITEADFLEAIEDAGGTDVRAVAERYTQTDATPEMWSRKQHRAAFEQPVAAFDYELGSEPLTVAGQDWKRWGPSETDDTDGNVRDVIAVPVGEPVSVPVAVSNVGDRDGTYDATLSVDGRVADQQRGTLGPGKRASHRLSWTPTRPGEYEVRVGTQRLTAVVRSPSSVTVTDLQVAPESTSPGDPVTATATVEAAGERPAATVLEFRTAEGVVATRPLALRPDETTTVGADLQFDERGRYEIAVAGETTIVDVGTGPGATLEEMSGFGVPAALGAVVVVVAVTLTARSHRK
ncbi:hypothetical protein [Natrinema halophilum]|uniref:CARDB domain-containing protein n=1 Tax=Natrinema halophilum TaxID=1699371 RepID=A0A7D5GLF9_9EURY|nr:hypothetical protein [Natrinema halophilum]QLG49850.1 hypothetical protein HYG82_13780 [Natrinema halophilum]